MTADRIGDHRRVVVAGTNYGRFYLRALELLPRRYLLHGIVALGSDRSRRVADRLGVPLVRRIDDLEVMSELVCWAVGRSGETAAVEILRSGVPMVCEHPIGTGFLDRALAAAAGTPFHVNGHFADLPVPQRFIAAAGECSRRLCGIKAAVTDRSLYAWIDLLARILPMDRLEVDCAGVREGFHTVSGGVSGVPLEVAVQTGNLRDGSPEYRVDIRVELEFTDGVLALDSVAGPLRWRERGAAADDAGTQLVGHRSPVGQGLLNDRIAANRRAVDDLDAQLDGVPLPSHQQPEHLLAVSRAWESVAAQLR